MLEIDLEDPYTKEQLDNIINYILDVRSTPYSQFAENYNRENIKATLKREASAWRRIRVMTMFL